MVRVYSLFQGCVPTNHRLCRFVQYQSETNKGDEMTREEAIAELLKIQQDEKLSKDCEYPHMEADSVLCQLLFTLGYGDVVTEYHRINKWYA